MAASSAEPTSEEETRRLCIVLDTPNACLPEGERLSAFKRGVMQQLLLQALRSKGHILEQANVFVMAVARPGAQFGATEEGWFMPKMVVAEADDELAQPHPQHMVVFVPPTKRDVIDWETATHRRIFPAQSVLVMLRMVFFPDDVPVDDTERNYCSTVVSTLNTLLREVPTLRNDLRPAGQLELLLGPGSERALTDHKDFVESQHFQALVSETNVKRQDSHLAMVTTLHELRTLQMEIIKAVREGKDWRHLGRQYQRQEGELLAVADRDRQTQAQCAQEEQRHTQVSLVAAGNGSGRAVASNQLDAMAKQQRPLAGLKEWRHSPLPSERQQLLKETTAQLSLSALAAVSQLQQEQERG